MGETPASFERPAEFRPLRPASRRRRGLGYLLGSVVWLVALLVLSVVVDRTDAVGIALLVVAASFLLGTVASLLMRRGRLREEERA
jgi:hypothetical protein